MFSRPERLQKRTPKDGVDRYEYLRQLVNEFKTSRVTSSKEQVLANLANFAYDPINYSFLRSLGVLDLFLDQLSEGNVNLVQFAIAGLCNLCVDPKNKEYILKNGGINAIANCLTSPDEQTKLSAITTLIFLDVPFKDASLHQDLVERIKQFSSVSDRRFKNLADIFLQNYGSHD